MKFANFTQIFMIGFDYQNTVKKGISASLVLPTARAGRTLYWKVKQIDYFLAKASVPLANQVDTESKT